jgi:hypothetical protein
MRGIAFCLLLSLSVGCAKSKLVLSYQPRTEQITITVELEP